jgi:hypothetical protein
MSVAPTFNHEIDSRDRLPRTQAESWIRLALVMVVPVLFLLVGMSLTR